MNEKPHYIYALTDPDTGDICYVGRSVNPLTRYADHMRTSAIVGLRKWTWAKTLEARGIKAGLIMLDKCDTRDRAKELEATWIKSLLASGAPLTNDIYPGYVSPGRGKRFGRWY